ncbi:hypothetical protein VST7929_02647 [Vibrio stylophorae]|uniref:DUF4156 domain-containing protein n=1 Tax=Vibrio stylophorae TaxID=659351 RepID=A0ABN8DXA7_9VIBR|nr:DUF4156 domain-containing protein [Vibrio stylophorae]CAH0534697.1 hypothetical protein VST7929_02647 [Vibrio stylophorae]
MKSVLRFFSAIFATLSLAGCVTFPTPESEKVKVYWDHSQAIAGCENLGMVIGSEGHFYDYWLHADRDMVWGAVNEMRIKVAEKGGDTLYLYQPFGFLSSVTLMGGAYRCHSSAEVAVL